jgi:hypothetical protein
VRPNVDTLYSQLFYDVSEQPLVISVPDMGNRYNLFPVYDMWTNVQASPGTRTLGNRPYQFAITGPNWNGTLPSGVIGYQTPTNVGWLIGRIQINDANDIPAVEAIQAKLKAVPLSDYANMATYSPPVNSNINPDWPKGLKVPAYIQSMTAAEYWDLFYSSLSHNQTLPQDTDFLAKMAQVGWSPNTPFNLTQLSAADLQVWEDAFKTALSLIENTRPSAPYNGWAIPRSGIGYYGTDYAMRAITSYIGLGANLPADAVYPSTYVDSTGAPLDAANSYTLHFAKDQMPPVRAFWSLTAYDPQGYFINNSINRYAVRGENLQSNADGSIDIYIQSNSPGSQNEGNWLPAPASGLFNLLLRLYWPENSVLNGSWIPPPVELAQPSSTNATAFGSASSTVPVSSSNAAEHSHPSFGACLGFVVSAFLLFVV